jgi:RNA polymerase sigma-70 factor (ECF subfamily)
MTHNKEGSEDMVQNVFYRMLKYRHTYTGKGEFVAWAFHLSRNVLNDHLKKQQRLGKQDGLDAISELLSGDSSADEQLSKKQAQLQLFKILEKLSDEEREILALSKFQELKYQEIAQILNISEGAVKLRVHRAFAHLKDIYLKMGAYEL